MSAFLCPTCNVFCIPEEHVKSHPTHRRFGVYGPRKES